MTNTFCFADNVAGLMHAFNTTLSQRRAGNKTRLVQVRVAGFTLQCVESTPPVRPNRKARGCELSK